MSDRKFEVCQELLKLSKSLGLVFGYAIVCKIDGEDYYDLQGDHIPEDVMVKATCDFMQGDRVMKDMHTGGPVGQVVFAFPMTMEIAQALGITITKSGLLAALRPADPAIIGKFESGEYTGFSIGGYVTAETLL